MSAALHHSNRPARGRLARAGCFASVLVAGIAALALLDVIPGGWRLRTLIIPQSVQDTRRRASHRADRMELFAKEPTPAPGGTLFLGSSTIERFPLAEHFGALAPLQLSPINRGIGDEDLAGLEARALATARRLQPARVVLYAGSVNVRRAIDNGTWTPPGDIVVRAGQIAQQLLAQPSIDRVVLLGILPERETGGELETRVREANAGLAALAAWREGISFLPTARGPLVDESGDLRPDYTADRLHLNEAGYGVLAGWLSAHLSDD